MGAISRQKFIRWRDRRHLAAFNRLSCCRAHRSRWPRQRAPSNVAAYRAHCVRRRRYPRYSRQPATRRIVDEIRAQISGGRVWQCDAARMPDTTSL